MSIGFDGGTSPLNQAAQYLIKSAESQVKDETINPNIWHILLVALTDANIAAHRILKGNLDEQRYQSLISYVKNRAQDPGSSYKWSLNIYLQACSEVAREESIEINDALILWQIIQKNLSVSSLFLSHGIDMRQLQQMLQDAVDAPLPSTEDLKSTDALALFRLPHKSMIPALAIPEIWRNITPVLLTRNLLDSIHLKQIDHNMHSDTMKSLTTAMASVLTERHNHVVMITGANGSAIDLIEYLLAYWIGQTEPGILRHPDIPFPLNRYKLWKVSASSFRDIARRRRLSFNSLLSYLKEQAELQKAILLLTDLESIPYDSTTGRKIREQLAHPDNVCIVGCGRYTNAVPSEEEQRFGLDNAILVSVEKMDDKRQFYDFIRKYHLLRWTEQGYTVDSATFDSLFILEEGIWISRKRKTWPYLGIDLVDDCIATVKKKDEQNIRKLTMDARIAIGNLLTKEAHRAGYAVRTKIDAMLKAAQQRIERLYQYPSLPQQGGYIVVSQAMMEAQLFCRNSSEYHYPGIHP